MDSIDNISSILSNILLSKGTGFESSNTIKFPFLNKTSSIEAGSYGFRRTGNTNLDKEND